VREQIDRAGEAGFGPGPSSDLWGGEVFEHHLPLLLRGQMHDPLLHRYERRILRLGGQQRAQAQGNGNEPALICAKADPAEKSEWFHKSYRVLQPSPEHQRSSHPRKAPTCARDIAAPPAAPDEPV
jgi:hypothetical protein